MGKIIFIKGPVINAKDIKNPRIHDLVLIGEDKLYGEILSIYDNTSVIQVYEPTEGLSIGDLVESTDAPLTVELGPGLINTIFDGLQRPLELEGEFIKHKFISTKLDRKKKWEFKPSVKKGDKLEAGSIIGVVKEFDFNHYIMVPPDVSGVVTDIKKGNYNLKQSIASIKTINGIRQIYMFHRWPVKVPRPVKKMLLPDKPLITGQRVIDSLIPISIGGTAVIPGPFGAGKTVLQQGFVKYANTDVKVFIGCGERGNEMADLLSRISDNKDGSTILIVNTSNMPIIARESGIYTAVTIAEYFRDMGYNVLLMADSLSRWAEALREVSSTMDELPAEEGFPSYLPSRIAKFFERASRAVTLNDNKASVTIISSLSPPGGDFSEPVTQYGTSMAGCSWYLDVDLAFSRHFPAINWDSSYSKYLSMIDDWWELKEKDWKKNIKIIRQLLEKEAELNGLVKAIGFVALSNSQKIELTVNKIIHEGFLKQNAFHKVDYYCEPEKQILLLNLIVNFYDYAMNSSKTADEIINSELINKLMNLKKISFESLKNEKTNIIDEIKKVTFDGY